MFNFLRKKSIIKNLSSGSIREPITAMCKCGHKWSWHYIDSNDNKCYAHEITKGEKCTCKGYEE